MSILRTGIKLTKAAFFTNLILQCAFLSLYFVFIVLLQQIVGSSDELYLMAYGTYHLIIAITLMACLFFLQKINNIKNIYRCSIAMLATIITLSVFPKMPFGMVLIFIGGVLFAIGQLISFTYFWGSTISEERGRIAGFIGFLGIPFSYSVGQLAQFLDLFGIVILAVFFILGILATKFLKPEERIFSKNNAEKEVYTEKRTVLLYAIPWILFAVVNSTLDRNISLNVLQSVPESLYFSFLLLQTIAAGFGALGGGILADLSGRKKSLGFSLTLYGLSTALGGLIQNIEVAYFVYAVSGLNWGILWSLYGSVIWGDLANEKNCVKRYSSGLIIFYLPIGFAFLFSEQICQISLAWSSLVGCSLIFFSNIPLFLAPELLSEDFRNKIRLKLHMNLLKKIDKKMQSQG